MRVYPVNSWCFEMQQADQGGRKNLGETKRASWQFPAVMQNTHGGTLTPTVNRGVVNGFASSEPPRAGQGPGKDEIRSARRREDGNGHRGGGDRCDGL